MSRDSRRCNQPRDDNSGQSCSVTTLRAVTDSKDFAEGRDVRCLHLEKLWKVRAFSPVNEPIKVFSS